MHGASSYQELLSTCLWAYRCLMLWWNGSRSSLVRPKQKRVKCKEYKHSCCMQHCPNRTWNCSKTQRIIQLIYIYYGIGATTITIWIIWRNRTLSVSINSWTNCWTFAALLHMLASVKQNHSLSQHRCRAREKQQGAEKNCQKAVNVSDPNQATWATGVKGTTINTISVASWEFQGKLIELRVNNILYMEL